VNVQNVNSAGSWADFVKLVQQARSRSNTPGVAPLKAAGLKQTVRLQAPAAARSPYGVLRNEQAGGAASIQAKQTKIAGGFFDAYA
jgi:hypothetical protein